MSRLIKKSPEQMTPDEREQYERIARGFKPSVDGTIGGPFDAWLRSPEVAKRALGWGNFLWKRTSIDRRLVELAIIITARFWESNVEWVSHSKMALDSGVSQAVIDEIFAGRRPEKAPADELLVYDVCIALHKTHQLPMSLFKHTVSVLGEQGLVEIIAAIGFYTFVSMTLNAFDVAVFDGNRGPFPLKQ
jgi:4-carboxymuconolactone decarboxylase